MCQNLRFKEHQSQNKNMEIQYHFYSPKPAETCICRLNESLPIH